MEDPGVVFVKSPEFTTGSCAHASDARGKALRSLDGRNLLSRINGEMAKDWEDRRYILDYQGISILWMEEEEEEVRHQLIDLIGGSSMFIPLFVEFQPSKMVP